MMFKATILIADDEPHLVHILAYNLRKVGAHVETACNGAECVEKAKRLHLDLIVSDYQMPILDGLQACMMLKADPVTSQIPVVMLTARGHRLTDAELAQTNIRRVLPKPLSARQLLEAVNAVLSERTGGEAA
jgi:two-component system alkaline phosphatase synthesis response regulator PhoP